MISGIPIPSFSMLVKSMMNKPKDDLLWFNNKNEMSLYYFSKGTWALKKGIELLLEKKGIKNGKKFVPSYFSHAQFSILRILLLFFHHSCFCIVYFLFFD